MSRAITVMGAGALRDCFWRLVCTGTINSGYVDIASVEVCGSRTYARNMGTIKASM